MTNGEPAANRLSSRPSAPALRQEQQDSRGRRYGSLRLRLVSVVSLIIAAIYLAIVAPFYFVILLNVKRESEALLREQSRLIQSLLPPDRNLIEKTLGAVHLGVFSLQLTGPDGIPQVKSGPMAGELPLPSRLEELIRDRRGSVFEEVRTRSGQHVRVLTTWLDSATAGADTPKSAFPWRTSTLACGLPSAGFWRVGSSSWDAPQPRWS